MLFVCYITVSVSSSYVNYEAAFWLSLILDNTKVLGAIILY